MDSRARRESKVRQGDCTQNLTPDERKSISLLRSGIALSSGLTDEVPLAPFRLEALIGIGHGRLALVFPR